MLLLSAERNMQQPWLLSDLGWGPCEFHRALFTSFHDVLLLQRWNTNISLHHTYLAHLQTENFPKLKIDKKWEAQSK